MGRVELGAKNLDIGVRMDGHDTVFLAIFQMPDANALDVYDRVLAKMADLEKTFPKGVTYDMGFDTTPYTRESIHEVVKTLGDAIILVAVVVLLFLQNFRSAIIPLVAVPVAIIGTFAVMALLGFSLNNLTLFGLILAIGIVVDDAIVVVEAVEHHIEQGLAPRGDDQSHGSGFRPSDRGGPGAQRGVCPVRVHQRHHRPFLPAVRLDNCRVDDYFGVQLADVEPGVDRVVFAPLSANGTDSMTKPAPLPRPMVALLGGWLSWTLLSPWLEQGAVAGMSGMLQTVLLVSTCLPGIIGGWLVSKPLNRVLATLFRGFNAGFAKATSGYVRLVGGLLRVSVIVLLVYGGLLALTYFRFIETPKGFIPAQDMGYLMVNVQLPDSASMERTDKVMRQIEGLAKKIPGVMHVTGISGQSFVLNAAGSNFGSLFVNLDPYPDRRDPDRSSDAIANKLRRPRVRRSRTPWWPSSAHRRCAAWAGRGASRS